VSKPFPTVGIIGAGNLSRMAIAPANELGIDVLLLGSEHKDLQSIRKFVSQCDVLTYEAKSIPLSIIKSLEAEGVVVRPPSIIFESLAFDHPSTIDFEISVMVARSPHGQTTSWSPTQVIKTNDSVFTITPAPNISAEISEKAQKLALETASKAGATGVMTVEIYVIGQELFVKQLLIGLADSGNWSIEGSVTSQFEQHIRAILDLPLGDPTLTAPFIVTGSVIAGEKLDMYRPYLHLMARNPGLKFHQYNNEVTTGQQVGYLTLVGDNLEHVLHEVEHAMDYFSGAIDE
jgi:phosphoribosylaminoimidazole carboxylase (NCAIR synthetase)